MNERGVITDMTKSEAVERVLNLARNEIGYHEGANNYTKYAAELEKFPDLFWGQSKQYLPWCATWIVYLFYKAFGLDTGTKMLCISSLPCGAAGCLYAAQYYKDAGRWVTSPQPGDQIFFSYSAGEYSHTGIVESVSGNTVNTIEGNTSDMVARRSYSMSSGSIVGYGRPRWELAEDAPADGQSDDSAPAPVTPDEPEINFNIILRKGSKGIEVRKMQEFLQQLGYDLGRYGADGDFGRDTRNAVKKFQQDYNVQPVDGEVGPITWAAIMAAIAPTTKEEGTMTDIDAINASGVSIGYGENVPVTVSKPKMNYPTIVIGGNIDDEYPPDDGYRFHIGDMVDFIGNGWYPSANAKIGVKIEPQTMIVVGVNHTAAHPYRLRTLQRFNPLGMGWVDEDAITELPEEE